MARLVRPRLSWEEAEEAEEAEWSERGGGGGGPNGAEEAVVRTEQVSYFARLADAATFATQALGEVHRRGVEAAAAVGAVQDGAVWLQGVVDLHCPRATRILDFPHAAEHLTTLAEAVFGRATPRSQRVAARLRGWLWREGPERLLRVVAGWGRAHPDDMDLARAVAYFTERRAQLDYPAFRAAGWPVGSGATESGHKQVMQARMKRAGMRWARSHVNPLLALSLLEHNGRWPEEGAALLAAHRTQCLQQRRTRQHARRLARHPLPPSSRPIPLPTRLPLPPPVPPPAPTPPTPPVPHPWRRYDAPLPLKT